MDKQEDCKDIEKKLHNCVLTNTREGAWPYYDCRDILDKYSDMCKKKTQEGGDNNKEKKSSPIFQ